jgi:hypothetical protein
VCEDRCREQLDLVRSWLTLDHQECASWLLCDYMDQFGGARFDKLANGDSPPGVITESDLDAVRALSIRFPRSFVQALEGDDVKERLGKLLVEIPADAVLEDLSCEQFDKHLGRGSAAWAAWEELSGLLKAAGARAPYVGASKLLAAKRVRLIPLEDSYVRRVLNTRRPDIWMVIHCLVRDPQVREGLLRARAAVPAAGQLTVHRTLDIIAWRKHQGHYGLA